VVALIPLNNFLILSTILFALGMYGVLARRSAVLILMSVDFIAFAVYLDPGKFTGIIFAVFVITVAAAEVGLALAIILRLFRNKATANVDEADIMKW
jgi:NADH:ubiquinone oxidoreductase subunit K